MNGNKLKSLIIIHYALIIGVFIYMLITYANHRNLSFLLDFKNIYFQIGLGLIIASLITHKLIYKRALQNKLELKTASEKWNKYQTMYIVRMANLEGAAFANIGLVYLSGNMIHLIFAFIAYIMMLEYHPNAKKIATEWNLTEEEVNEM